MPPRTKASVVRFDNFRFLPRQRLLLAGDTEVRIGDRALDILAALIERAGTLVTKQELITCVWPHSVVEEINLRVHIAALRRALGDGTPGSRYILNTAGRGYSFVAPVSFEADPSPEHSPGSPVPVPCTEIIGRSRDLELLVELARSHRLVNITGPAGVGKSTLALAIAHQLARDSASECTYVDMATMTDPSLVFEAVNAALGPRMCPGRDALHEHRHLLVVLDNCEHALTAAASVSELLLRTTTHVHVLATSREALGAEAEWRYVLPPLDVPPSSGIKRADLVGAFSAVRLFVCRAAMSFPSFTLSNANAHAVADICRRLDGIPLAIVAAAGLLASLDVHDLASQPDVGLLAMESGRTDQFRHHTLRAALDSSLHALAPLDRFLLRRLSVFRGPFSFQSALSLAARSGLDHRDVRQGILSLTEKSLLQSDVGRLQARHRMLHMTRARAFEELTASSEASMIHRWHAEEVSRLLSEALMASNVPAAQWAFDREYFLVDAEAAVTWAFSEHGDSRMGNEITDALNALMGGVG